MTNPQFAVANLLTPQSPAPAGNASAERKANALLKRAAEAPKTQAGFSANLADPAGASPSPAGTADGQAGQATIKRSSARTKQDKPTAGTPAGAKQSAAAVQTATPFAALVHQLVQETSAGAAQPVAAKGPVFSSAKTTKTPAVTQFAMGPEQPKPAPASQLNGARQTTGLAASIPSQAPVKTAPSAGVEPAALAGASAQGKPAAESKPAAQAAAVAKAIDASGAAVPQAAKAAPDAAATPQSPKATRPDASASATQAAPSAAQPAGATAPVPAVPHVGLSAARMDFAVAAIAMARPSRHAADGGRTAAQAPPGSAQLQTTADTAGGTFRSVQAAARAQSLNIEISEITQRAKAAAEESAAAPLEQSAATVAGGETYASEAAAPRAAAVHAAAGAGPAALRSPAEQIADAIPAGGTADGQRIVLRLTPPDLGTVRVTFERDGDGVRGTVQADNPRTLVEIQREASALAERMASSGIELRKLDLQLSNHGGERGASSGSGFTGGDGRQWQHEFRDGSEIAASDAAAAVEDVNDSVNVYL